ncbi:ABC transporter ATP-binding protein [Streptomyces liangshanensis]|uniref:ABC transporter ATP-binding protein n=1 Tax=Streptomyces liangshanensis TaxID=2717324 RepID=A0A6G9H6F5_9ACTN|nr:ABC transporter ATP-binding protein [Streptomyces liangshanensis]QIQ05886.1 ABC transporter ATP-binding protein [Streptomyces liangshanensis]
MNPTTSVTAQPLLAARELSKTYGSTVALSGASARLDAGEIVALTGRSGSGKSTLLHCMAGIVRPDHGSVTYRQLDVDVSVTHRQEQLEQAPEERLSALRRTEFAVVFQFGQLIPELTALDNVALPLILGGTDRRAAQERARAWLERFGVLDRAEARPGELSGGQAQRVALARALVTGPKVVFADEPTGALDSLAGEQVMTELTSAARESGAAVLLVTHDATVAAYADREIRLTDGRTTVLEVSA